MTPPVGHPMHPAVRAMASGAVAVSGAAAASRSIGLASGAVAVSRAAASSRSFGLPAAPPPGSCAAARSLAAPRSRPSCAPSVQTASLCRRRTPQPPLSRGDELLRGRGSARHEDQPSRDVSAGPLGSRRGSRGLERSRTPRGGCRSRSSGESQATVVPRELEDYQMLSKNIVRTCRYSRCACVLVELFCSCSCRNYESLGLQPLDAEQLVYGCRWFLVPLLLFLGWCCLAFGRFARPEVAAYHSGCCERCRSESSEGGKRSASLRPCLQLGGLGCAGLLLCPAGARALCLCRFLTRRWSIALALARLSLLCFGPQRSLLTGAMDAARDLWMFIIWMRSWGPFSRAWTRSASRSFALGLSTLRPRRCLDVSLRVSPLCRRRFAVLGPWFSSVSCTASPSSAAMCRTSPRVSLPRSGVSSASYASSVRSCAGRVCLANSLGREPLSSHRRAEIVSKLDRR